MRLLISSLVFLIILNTSWAKGQFETKDMKEPTEMAFRLLKKYNKDNIIVVFDIDNTLLAMKQDFGSDQWFGWQSGLIKQQKWDLTAGKSFNDLLKLNEKIFAISPMRLTQKEIPSLIKKLQDKSITVIALTSRGPELRNSTERELSNKNIDLAKTSIGPGIAKIFIPKGFKRNVSFMNGVFMTSGQHKGKMLKFLMDYYKKSYKAVVFIDDHKKHTQAVFRTFGGINDVNVYRYGREDEAVERFKKSDKKVVNKKLKNLKKLLKDDYSL